MVLPDWGTDTRPGGGIGPLSVLASTDMFYNFDGNKCAGILNLGVLTVVCVLSNGRMGFAPIKYWDANGDNPYCGNKSLTTDPNPICIKLTGDVTGSSTLFDGRASGTLSHMAGSSCSWTGLLSGGSCNVRFTNSPGVYIHYDWHNQGHNVGSGLNNGWQCHAGTSQADALLSGTVLGTAHHAHQPCYTYAPPGTAPPAPPPGW